MWTQLTDIDGKEFLMNMDLILFIEEGGTGDKKFTNLYCPDTGVKTKVRESYEQLKNLLVKPFNL